MALSRLLLSGSFQVQAPCVVCMVSIWYTPHSDLFLLYWLLLVCPREGVCSHTRAHKHARTHTHTHSLREWESLDDLSLFLSRILDIGELSGCKKGANVDGSLCGWTVCRLILCPFCITLVVAQQGDWGPYHSCRFPSLCEFWITVCLHPQLEGQGPFSLLHEVPQGEGHLGACLALAEWGLSE